MSLVSELRLEPTVSPPQPPAVKNGNTRPGVEAVLKHHEGIELASKGSEKSFIWPEGSRPDISHDNFDFEVPVIDLSPVLKLQSLRNEIESESEGGVRVRCGLQEEIEACEAAKSNVTRAIRVACEGFGFFQIINHGFPADVRNDMMDSFGEIFELPLEEKMRIKEKTLPGRPPGPGYLGMKRNNPFTRQLVSFVWSEGINLESPEMMYPGRTEEIANILYPEEPERSTKGHLFSSGIEEYGKQSSKLCYLLLDLIAASLGIPEDSVRSLFGDRRTTQAKARLRINSYPVCDRPELTWGLRGHTDASVITLLHQDAVGGLQVRFRDETWHGVKPMPGALVINCGDFMQAWTNGRFLSAEHRVVTNEKKRRISIAYLAVNEMGCVISPRPECVDAEHPLRYKSFTMPEYILALSRLGVGRDRGDLLDKAFGINYQE